MGVLFSGCFTTSQRSDQIHCCEFFREATRLGLDVNNFMNHINFFPLSHFPSLLWNISPKFISQSSLLLIALRDV